MKKIKAILEGFEYEINRNYFLFNSWPSSARANKKGIIEQIGKSLSVKFDLSKYKENTNTPIAYEIKEFSSVEDCISYGKKLSKLLKTNWLEDLAFRHSKGFFYLKDNDKYILYLATKIIGRIRDRDWDERIIIINMISQSKCLICDEEIDHYSTYLGDNCYMQFISFDNRVECICAKCQKQNNFRLSPYGEKMSTLTKIIKAKANNE